MDKIIQEYCIGCGLCQSLGKAELICNQKGYLSPVKGDEKWLRTVCPAGGKQCASMDFNHIWGRIEAVYYGFSADEVLRRQASSGGSLTEIASYLLESKKVDAIFISALQVKIQRKKKYVSVHQGRNYLADVVQGMLSVIH